MYVIDQDGVMTELHFDPIHCVPPQHITHNSIHVGGTNNGFHDVTKATTSLAKSQKYDGRQIAA